MRGYLFRSTFLAAILPLFACERPSTSDEGFPPAGETSFFEPIRVLDGDTFIVAGEVVRLAGVDAPELPPRAACWAEAGLATQAKDRADQMLNSDGATWSIANPRGRNANGHLLASLRRGDGEDLGDWLAVQGLAARADDWDWCGASDTFTREDGPTVWNPVPPVLDERAYD